MIQGDGAAALLWYVYRPLASAAPGDGGFRLTLYENDTLVYTMFNELRQPVQTLYFPLAEELRLRITGALDAAAWWLQDAPERIRAGHPAADAAMIGVAGFPMVVLDEMEAAAALPFATPRGHWARRLLLLLEDVSEMLAGCGIYLEPRSFGWNPDSVFPHEEQPQEGYDDFAGG